MVGILETRGCSDNSTRHFFRIEGTVSQGVVEGASLYTPTKVDFPDFRKTFPDNPQVLLNDSTTGTFHAVYPGSPLKFYDEGGAYGDYSGRSDYIITFDAGLGNHISNITINSFEFEHSTSRMWDRLGIQVSNDGTNFINLGPGSGIDVEWLQTSSNPSPPWSTSFGGTSYVSAASTNGWILPMDTARARSLSSTPLSFPATIDIDY